jgi:hypothetical protein
MFLALSLTSLQHAGDKLTSGVKHTLSAGRNKPVSVAFIHQQIFSDFDFILRNHATWLS